jgi:NAD(P)-dependent dehydrogenase (short-subunit alcohol dehydrogenase family)
MKTAIITGAAGGLGRALTAALIARGLHVCALDLPGDAPWLGETSPFTLAI